MSDGHHGQVRPPPRGLGAEARERLGFRAASKHSAPVGRAVGMWPGPFSLGRCVPLFLGGSEGFSVRITFKVIPLFKTTVKDA